MPVSGSIYSQFKPVDLAEGWEQGQRIRENSMKLSDLAKQRDDAEKYKEILSQNTGPDGSMDAPKVLSALKGAGLGQHAFQLEDQLLNREKTRADIAKTNADANRKGEVDPYKQLMFQQRMEDRNRAALERKEKDITNQIQKYSSSTSDMSDIVSQMNTIQDHINLDDEKADVAGFGGTYWAPDMLVSQKGQDTRQAVSGLRNTILKARSGGAVTPQEADRMLAELGEGKFKDDRQLVSGLRNIRNQLSEALQDREAPLSREAREEYANRRAGGLLSARLRMGSPVTAGKDGGGFSGMNSAHASEKPAIKHGTVEDGFVFMGGDPADQKNWKKRAK